MMSSAVNLEDIDKKRAKELALLYIDTVQQFVQSIANKKPALGFHSKALFLREMRWRIEQPSPQFSDEAEIKKYLHPVRDAIIRFNPAITNQLHNFWEAQIRIIEASNQKGERYDPGMLVDKNRDNITNINMRFEKVLERFVANPNDEINIDAVLYMHILRTESYGKKLKEQLEASLQNHHLDKEFNAAQIYSVTEPAVRQTRKKMMYLTDAECIRNALAHNNYEIKRNSSDWKIIFDNKGERDYHFRMELTKRQLLWYLSNTEILYKATTTLLYIQIFWAIVRNRLL